MTIYKPHPRSTAAREEWHFAVRAAIAVGMQELEFAERVGQPLWKIKRLYAAARRTLPIVSLRRMTVPEIHDTVRHLIVDLKFRDDWVVSILWAEAQNTYIRSAITELWGEIYGWTA